METLSSALLPPHVINISDLRRMAQRRLPRAVFDYLDGGADDEVTMRENERAFQDIIFRPRQAVSFRDCNLDVRVLSHELSFPAMLAPVGYSRMMHPGGEVAAAQAAGEFGSIYILSTVSGHKMENVRAATKGPAWYQLYLVGGRGAAEAGIDRARQAGFDALVVTVDTPVAGMRERDPRNGMKQLLGKSLFAKLPFLSEIMAHPRWLAGLIADGGMPKLENIILPGEGPMKLIDVSAALAQTGVEWADLKWIRNIWTGPILIKGILTSEDAKRAVDEGVAGIVVSNHGGRQLDSASATIRALPEVVAAVRGRIEVLMDGGIRRGGDIVKAICLGAKAVLVGRAYAYGMAAAGHAGVTRALQILRDDVARTLHLLGCPSITALDASYVEFPQSWRR
ncbi:MAG TPA: alpha-hydroxy acid oxidase [Candidatus Acidoferrum sp.]|nr:alpha-hydroxy acid oxidase [Candidatus Acidoferrum sp.]